MGNHLRYFKYSKDLYPYLYVIGGSDLFTLSLTTDENPWQESKTNPDPDTSKWRAFGLGYHNYEFFEDELCNKQGTIRVINISARLVNGPLAFHPRKVMRFGKPS